MGLYTKKVKGDEPPKEVKKKGRPKKVVPIAEEVLEVEQPKNEETLQTEPEPQKVEEVKELPPPREKTPPPVQIQEPEPEPLKKSTVKKKIVKKVEKKVAPKEEEPPAWFKKFISEVGHEPTATKKENRDFTREVASEMWNKGVKPRGSTSTSQHSGYEKLYNQIFGR